MILEITVKMKDGKIFKYNSQAEAIKNARLQAGLSQEQAADLVGIKVQAWQKYEYGEREPKAEMLEKTKIVVFVSGGGTNLQAIIDAAKSGLIKSGEIVGVVSSSPTAYAIERAKKEGIPYTVVSLKECSSK